MTTPNGNALAGGTAQGAETEKLGNFAAYSASAYHAALCLCRNSTLCGWCHLRRRIDEAFARARSLRLQSLGEPGRGGAWL